MSITDFDISQLAPPSLIETLSFETVRAALLADFQTRWPDYDVGTQEDDPISMLLETAAAREIALRARINDVARAEVITLAAGADLDLLGAFYDVTRMTDETDERLRSRIILAIAGRSPGGTAERYEYIAMSADVRISRAVAWVSTTSPVVHISILNSLNNGVPYPEMIAAVEAAVNATNVKMVNDTIVVDSAVKSTANITADVWLLPGAPESTFTNLEASLRGDWDVDGGLGRDLVASWIIAHLMKPGVQRVVLNGFTNVSAEFNQAIVLGTIALTNKGRAY